MIDIPMYDNTKSNRISMYDRLESIGDKILNLEVDQFIKFNNNDKDNTIRLLRNTASNMTGKTFYEHERKAKPYKDKVIELMKN